MTRQLGSLLGEAEHRWLTSPTASSTRAGTKSDSWDDLARKKERINQSITLLSIKKDMHSTTHDLQYMGWSQQNMDLIINSLYTICLHLVQFQLTFLICIFYYMDI